MQCGRRGVSDEMDRRVYKENKLTMVFREARVTDIPQIQVVRNSVKENTLSNPALVTDNDCENYLVIAAKAGFVRQMAG